MDAAADLFVGEVGEELLNLTDPGGRGRGGLHPPTRPFGEPVADGLGLVGGYVVHDDVDVDRRERWLR